MYSRTRGYLPHIVIPQSIYFVTFRLADSLPASVLRHCKEEASGPSSISKTMSYRYRQIIEKYLDSSYGECWLRQPEIALIVDTAIRHFNNDRYELFVWTIMPNHVHVLFKPLKDFSLSSTIHSWKSYTANEANRILKRTGEFWQREYFDVLVKSERQLEFCLRYILNNPVKAGLCEEVFQWRWMGCSAEMQDAARRFFL